MKKKKNHSIILRFLLLCVSLYLVFSLSSLWSELNEKRDEYNKIVSEKEEYDRKNEELKNLLAEGNESRIIEKAARERLGYVFPDEQIYIDISGN